MTKGWGVFPLWCLTRWYGVQKNSNGCVFIQFKPCHHISKIYEIWFFWSLVIFMILAYFLRILPNFINYVGKCRFLILHQLYHLSTVQEHFGRSLDAVGNDFVKVFIFTVFSQHYFVDQCWLYKFSWWQLSTDGNFA